MHPPKLQPTATQSFFVNDQTIEIPICVVKFDKWTGTPIKETFGGKPLLNVNGKPMFAELAIMTEFVTNGWQTRWVETYGKNEPICLTEWQDDKYKNQVHHPFQESKVSTLLADIAKVNSNSYSGCWDVVAVKNEKIIFAESKRTKKDNIRTTQVNWLIAGLKCGLQTDNFLIVQWDM